MTFPGTRRDYLALLAGTGMSLVPFLREASIAQQAASPQSQKAGRPLYGGTIVVGLGSEPRVINPGLGSDFSQQLVASPLYGNLLALDFDLRPRADLAESWTVSPDGKEYSFVLRDNVRWHDGKPFTSDDVAFTFEKVLARYHGSAQLLLQMVDRIDAPDPHRVVFRLKTPYEPFIIFVGREGRILPKHVFEKGDVRDNPANLRPIGTGPFRIVEWKKGSHIALERNETFYDPDLPYLDKMIFKFIPDAAGRLLALESGEIDYLPGLDLPPSGVGRLTRNPALTVTSRGHETWAAITEMMFNLDRAPLNDVRIRKAVTHAIDREFINEKAGFGLNRAAVGPMSSEMAWSYTPDVRKYKYDPMLANQMLDDAGVIRGPDGNRLHLNLVCFRNPDVFGKIASIVAEQLKQVGIDVKVSILDRPTAIELVYVKRNFDLFIHSMTAGPDPATGVARQYKSENIRPLPFTNVSGYRNAEVDNLFEQAAIAPSHEERGKLYKDVSKIIVEDAVMVWIYEDTTNTAFRREFENLHTWSADSLYRVSSAVWSKGTPGR